MADPTLPYMKQLPADFYAKNVPAAPAEVAPTPDTAFTPSTSEPPVDPTLPVNEGGIWIGSNYPDNPGEGWLFFDTDNNTLYIYVDGAWQVAVPTSGPGGGIPEAPTDGGTYARQNTAWTSTYDGGAY